MAEGFFRFGRDNLEGLLVASIRGDDHSPEILHPWGLRWHPKLASREGSDVGLTA
jgi:hypothetical protein